MLFSDFLGLYPSTKLAITPMFFEQIEKFQCLTLSTTQGLSTGTLRFHVSRAHKRVTKLLNFEGLYFSNPPVKYFKNHFSHLRGLLLYDF